jgi:eukaryotic-like serine/threonine-protein kinase
MSNGATAASANGATFRTLRELGSRAQRSFAALREPNELVVLHRFVRAGENGDGVAAVVSAETMGLLLRDARALAKHWHPNVVRVRYADVVGGELSIATELVDGVTLDDLTIAARAARANPREPAIPHTALVRILVDVLGGLHGLHGLRDGMHAPLGAYHGEICPTNVIVGKDGVARIANVFRPRPVQIVAKSEALGYAAPEVLAGETTQDARADVYAVGVMLWEGLTGRRLYEECDPARLAQRQREEELPRPVIPESSPFARLVDVAMQAIAFDPALRFRSASEMAAELRRVAGTRLAPGSAVAQKVVDLAGERIRARRAELDPNVRLRPSPRAIPVASEPPPSLSPDTRRAGSEPDLEVLRPGASPAPTPSPQLAATASPAPTPSPQLAATARPAPPLVTAPASPAAVTAAKKPPPPRPLAPRAAGATGKAPSDPALPVPRESERSLSSPGGSDPALPGPRESSPSLSDSHGSTPDADVFAIAQGITISSSSTIPEPLPSAPAVDQEPALAPVPLPAEVPPAAASSPLTATPPAAASERETMGPVLLAAGAEEPAWPSPSAPGDLDEPLGPGGARRRRLMPIVAAVVVLASALVIGGIVAARSGDPPKPAPVAASAKEEGAPAAEAVLAPPATADPERVASATTATPPPVDEPREAVADEDEEPGAASEVRPNTTSPARPAAPPRPRPKKPVYEPLGI